MSDLDWIKKTCFSGINVYTVEIARQPVSERTLLARSAGSHYDKNIKHRQNVKECSYENMQFLTPPVLRPHFLKAQGRKDF